MPVYGEAYVTYGAGTCALCKGRHDRSQHVPETSASRFKLMQLLVGLVYDEMVRGTVSLPNLQERRMFGILITPQRVYAAHSGPTFGGSTPYLRRAAAKGYKICAERSSGSHAHRTASGIAIPAAVYASSKRRYETGNCAAPRLVGEALDDYGRQGWPVNLSGWQMSEVMFDPVARGPEWKSLKQAKYINDKTGELNRKGKDAKRNMEERFGGNDWTHALSAPHCVTCDVLVPILLCPHGDSLQDLQRKFDAGSKTSVNSRIAAWERNSKR